MENEFHLILPSNASMDLHPENRGGNYTVVLPETLNISPNDWEVGLEEISFSKDWPTLVSEDIWVAIDYVKAGKWTVGPVIYLAKAEATKTYANVEEFIKGPMKGLIKGCIVAAGHTMTTYTVEKEANKERKDRHFFTITIPLDTSKQDLKLYLSPTILEILGIARDQLKKNRWLSMDMEEKELIIPRGRNNASLAKSTMSLWVYSDLVKPHMVGNIRAPLLRIIAVPHQENPNEAMEVTNFPSIHYYTLDRGNISNISIQIYNMGGKEPIKFGAPVICTLHIRRRAKMV